jgi:hypothetical protein
MAFCPRAMTLDYRRLNLKTSLSVNTDDPRLADARLLADVLMAVKEQARLDATNVSNKRLEAEMDLVVSVMNVSWGIVSHENINAWESSEQPRHFNLLVEKMASRLVPPRATKAAERQTPKARRPKMQVNDGSGKGSSTVVIAFDGEDAGTLGRLCRLQNDLVCHVAAGNENVCTLSRRRLRERVVVRNHEELHAGLDDGQRCGITDVRVVNCGANPASGAPKLACSILRILVYPCDDLFQGTPIRYGGPGACRFGTLQRLCNSSLAKDPPVRGIPAIGWMNVSLMNPL